MLREHGFDVKAVEGARELFVELERRVRRIVGEIEKEGAIGTNVASKVFDGLVGEQIGVVAAHDVDH